MGVQIILFILVIIGYFAFGESVSVGQNDSRKKYIIFVSVLLILQSGLRGLSVGPDTNVYCADFKGVALKSWDEIWYGFHEVYIEGTGKDAGYPLFVKMFQIINTDYQIFLIFVAFVFFYAFGRFLYINTSSNKDVLLAVAIYQAVFYSFMSITGIRQTLATAFTLFAFEYIKNNKWIKFILLLFIASFLHKSCLVFAAAYLVCKISNVRFVLISSAIGAIILFPLGRTFAAFLVGISGSDSYMGYITREYETQGAQTFALMMVMMLILLLKYGKEIVKSDEQKVLQLKIFSLAVLFTPFTWIDPSLMRVVQYFSIFMVSLLPSIITQIEYSNRNNGNTIYQIVLLFFMFVTLSRQAYYVFFWEEL